MYSPGKWGGREDLFLLNSVVVGLLLSLKVGNGEGGKRLA